MSRLRASLLVAIVFLCPWCTGLVTLEGTRLAASDLLLLPVLACLLLTVRPGEWTAYHLGFLAFGLLAAFSALSLLAASFLPVVLMKIVRLAGILAPALLVTRQSLPTLPLHRLERAFFWGGLVSVAYGAVAFVFQWESGIAVQSYYFGSDYLRRAGGAFLDASAFGHVLATWCVISLLFVLPSLHSLWSRAALLLLTLPLTAYSLYASVSRAALLHLLVVGAGLLILPRRLDRGPFYRFAGVSLLTLALAALFVTGFWDLPVFEPVRFVFARIGQTVQAMLEGVESLDRSGGNRLSSWAAAFDLWLQSPLLGVGYKALAPSYGLFVDNTLVLTLVETGIFGFLAFTATGLGFLVHAARAYAAELPLARRLLLFWLGQTTHSLVVDTITFSGSITVVLVLGTAWTLMTARQPRQAQPLSTLAASAAASATSARVRQWLARPGGHS